MLWLLMFLVACVLVCGATSKGEERVRVWDYERKVWVWRKK